MTELEYDFEVNVNCICGCGKEAVRAYRGVLVAEPHVLHYLLYRHRQLSQGVLEHGIQNLAHLNRIRRLEKI